ncbi:hypothetical protein PV326_007206 [Microctonus aethiopoides]|nr:hypothetical protein PV326_007206 [Microctonus aethiopoides]
MKFTRLEVCLVLGRVIWILSSISRVSLPRAGCPEIQLNLGIRSCPDTQPVLLLNAFLQLLSGNMQVMKITMKTSDSGHGYSIR